jgi:uncharacterized protein YcgI (DUF1989 family)
MLSLFAICCPETYSGVSVSKLNTFSIVSIMGSLLLVNLMLLLS